MTEKRDLLELSTQYHKAIPDRIRRYLNSRGIPDVLIDFHLLGWNGWRVTIPVFNYDEEVVFFKLAKDPEDPLPGPKMVASPGSYVELYGWSNVRLKPRKIIICEGEFDRLVLEGNGFYAVTSTGGALTFKPEWAEHFDEIPEVYICFDRDDAGQRGTLRVARLISQAKLVELPEEVGQSGDVTDFFVGLGKSRKDFLKLLEQAEPPPPAPPEPEIIGEHSKASNLVSPLRERVERIKSELPITKVIAQYVKLRASGKNLVGICPFHDDNDPSLVVYPDSSTFYCFGCFKHGDAITFLQEKEGLTFSQAVEALDHLHSHNEPRSQNNC